MQPLLASFSRGWIEGGMFDPASGPGTPPATAGLAIFIGNGRVGGEPSCFF